MGQPTPPGDMPLIEGLDSSWNEFVNYIPEDKRGEFGPKFKEKISGYESQIEAYKPWDEFQKSGITPEFADTAVRLFTTIENNPREVYETLGKHLGITTQQAKAVVEDMQENGESEDPRLAALQQKIEVMSQIMLAQHQGTMQQQQQAEADSQLDAELKTVMKKMGEVPEKELLRRMLHDGMSAEDAHRDYTATVAEIRARRPSPMILGSGGSVPPKQVDVKKLNSADTKSLVVQMLEHAQQERQ